MTRTRRSGGSYLSQHDSRLHFGLGPHEMVDRLDITWPDGTTSRLEHVKGDRYLTIRQGSDDD